MSVLDLFGMTAPLPAHRFSRTSKLLAIYRMDSLNSDSFMCLSQTASYFFLARIASFYTKLSDIKATKVYNKFNSIELVIKDKS